RAPARTRRRRRARRRRERAPRTSSPDYDGLALRAPLAFVVDPGELEIPARFGDGVEVHVWIGGNARGQIGAEHFHSVIAARKRVDDVALDEMPDDVVAVAGLHGVLDEDADFDDITAPRLPGNLDSCGHGMRFLRLSSRRDRRTALPRSAPRRTRTSRRRASRPRSRAGCRRAARAS